MGNLGACITVYGRGLVTDPAAAILPLGELLYLFPKRIDRKPQAVRDHHHRSERRVRLNTFPSAQLRLTKPAPLTNFT